VPKFFGAQQIEQEFAGRCDVSCNDDDTVRSNQRYIANENISLVGRNNIPCMIGLEQSNGHKVCCISGSTPLYDDDDDDYDDR